MWWLILSGVILISVSIYMLMSPTQTRTPQNYTEPPIDVLPGWSNMDNNPVVPQHWDEQLISQHFSILRNRPAALSHYFSSVLERFVLRQSDETAQVRTQFLRTQLDQLKLAKELHTALDDLTLHQLERDIRRRTLELQRQDLDNKQQQQQELAQLVHQQEKLKVKLEITKLSRQIKEEETPSPPPLSTEQQRAQKRAFHEAEIARKQDAKRKAVDQATTEDEKRRIANMHDDSIEREMEELSKYL
jgi:hypothetical protein